MNPPNKRRAALYLLAVFVAGLLAGAAGGFAYGRRPVFRPPPSAERMAEFMVHRFSAELGLSPEQRERFRPIAKEAAAAMQTLHRKTHEEMIVLFKETHQRIETMLTSEQVAKLREFEAREARKFGGHRPPPP